MAHILTDAEALAALRLTEAADCPTLNMLMSAVDDGLLTETGYDWTADAAINPTAKLAASILLVALNEGVPLPDSYRYKIVQLDAKVKSRLIDASLSALAISVGTLTPSFLASRASYVAAVSSESIEVTPTVNNSSASVTVNGTDVTSGSSSSIALNVGTNAISIVVTASDESTTKTYTIIVTRAA